eukprot:11835-Heterococcus_DN1.PRE.2
MCVSELTVSITTVSEVKPNSQRLFSLSNRIEAAWRNRMLGDAIAVGLAVAIYEFVGTAICGVVYLVKGRVAKPVEECSVQDDDAKELYEPVEASDEYEGSLTRVVLALKANSSSQIFLRRSDVAMLVEKLTSSDHHQFASPKLHKRLTLIDGSLSSLGPQAAEATMYTATLSSSSQQHDDASSMCSSVRSSDRGSYRKDYSSSSSNYSDEQQYTPQQAAHRRASSSADTVLTENSATPQRVSMSQRPRGASSVATDMDGAAELQEQQAPATPSVAQVATAVASARALARMRAAAAANSASGGSPNSTAAATTRKRVSYSAPRESVPDDAQSDSYDDYWL